MMTAPTDMDVRDQIILEERIARLDAVPGPRVGDWVRFADGIERRISYIWRDEHDTMLSVQTSAGGSYHLGDGYVSMSGSLFVGVDPATLTATTETRVGSVWFFHHNLWRAYNAIDTEMTFRMFTCSLTAPPS